jgi:hypothetical protein
MLRLLTIFCFLLLFTSSCKEKKEVIGIIDYVIANKDSLEKVLIDTSIVTSDIAKFYNSSGITSIIHDILKKINLEYKIVEYKLIENENYLHNPYLKIRIQNKLRDTELIFGFTIDNGKWKIFEMTNLNYKEREPDLMPSIP